MKKTILILLGFLFFVSATNITFAKTTKTNAATAAGIRMYKSGNYTQSYVSFSDIVKADPSNALAYYYLGMSSVRLGKKDEAIASYKRAAEMSPNGILGRYAKKGITCVEEPVKCSSVNVYFDEEDTDEDKFIRSKFGSGFSNKARGVYEQQKIENMKREINRNNELAPNKFKDYKDFSSQNPSNDEIVSAIRTLQQAGIVSIPGTNYSDISLLTGNQNYYGNSDFDMLNMMYNSGNNYANLNPQVIQTLLTNQMTANF